MSLATDQKQKIIKEYQTNEGDTGSPEVQVALLSQRIEKLTSHLKLNVHFLNISLCIICFIQNLYLI